MSCLKKKNVLTAVSIFIIVAFLSFMAFTGKVYADSWIGYGEGVQEGREVWNDTGYDPLEHGELEEEESFSWDLGEHPDEGWSGTFGSYYSWQITGPIPSDLPEDDWRYEYIGLFEGYSMIYVSLIWTHMDPDPDGSFEIYEEIEARYQQYQYSNDDDPYNNFVRTYIEWETITVTFVVTQLLEESGPNQESASNLYAASNPEATSNHKSRLCPRTPLGFVMCCYKYILSRAAVNEELQVWTDRLNGGFTTGANMVSQFIFSEECQDLTKDYTNEEFVRFLYQGVLHREADSEGLNAWVMRLDEGMTKEVAVKAFTSSEEFLELCESFGVSP